MTALLLADLAVETLVKVCVTHLGAKFEKEPLDPLIEMLVVGVPAVGVLPELRNARRLRRARNSVKSPLDLLGTKQGTVLR